MKLQDLLGEQNVHYTESCEIDQKSVKQDEFLSEEAINEKKKKNKRNLQKEVGKLKGELEDEQALNKALRAILHGPVLSQPRLSLLLLPPQVQELIEEMATVEAEIHCLEKRVGEMKIEVYQERRKVSDEQEIEIKLKQKQIHLKRLRRQNHLPYEKPNCDLSDVKDDLNHRSKSQNYEDVAKEGKKISFRTVSIGSAAEFLCLSSSAFKDDIDELSRTPKSRSRNRTQIREDSSKNADENPNKVSEELIRTLMEIFLELNRVSREKEGSTTVSKLSLSHLRSASFKRKATMSFYNASNLDPYGVLTNGAVRDVGPYKDFIHITRNSLDVSRLSELSPAIVRFRVLTEKLRNVDLSSLTCNQKLAFWINVHNACIMNACLEHGLPSSRGRFMTLMKKASLNVGGTMMNALDMERFVLRQPFELQDSVSIEEKETRSNESYGLDYSEPNLAFALCRGNWSSPALRVYTPESIMTDLDRARTEFLEASVGILGNKKKILVPEILRWHVGEFKTDVETLLEWICDQLPEKCSSLKTPIEECLDMESTKKVEIRPYEYEFRYLLSF